MHAVLATMGTDGDVFPYIGLGKALRARGHRVTLLANEHHRQAAEALGFEFLVLLTDAEYERLIDDPRLWHPWHSAAVGARMGIETLERQFALIERVSRGRDTIVVAHASVLAGRLVQDKFARPLVTLLLQPMMIRSAVAPPVLAAGPRLPRWAPALAVRAYFRVIDALGNRLLRNELNQFRRSLDLPPVRHVLRWIYSPELVVGMFPEWFARPQHDWLPQIHLADFPMYEGAHGTDELDAGLAGFCTANAAPVAFTMGTGMKHASRFFAEAIAACQMLNVPGVMLTKYRELLPAELPKTIRHVRFAPFSRLFPLCGAVVHHGGAGTVAMALAAGVPQLVLPLAWDQPDNADRVERLGAGICLPPRRRRAADLARALRELLVPERRRPCQALAQRMAQRNGLPRAARLIEEFFHSRFQKVRASHANPQHQ